MKKICLMTIVALIAAMSVYAQNEKNPQGLYRLKSFIYEDGRSKLPGFSQYKYVADSVGLLISYRQSRDNAQWSGMQVEIREKYPLVNTGDKPQGADGHGTQIFGVTDSLFCFKWYNERWPNMSKLNEFITEVYSKSRIEDEVVKSFALFENKNDAKENKFFGWWVRVGATANTDGTGKRMQVPVLYKAYGPEQSMVINGMATGDVLQCSTTGTIKYVNDTTIFELGHPCNMHWVNDDTHTLTFVQENGQPLTELWVRSGLPIKWQKVFHTNIDTYQNGFDCILNAVNSVIAGDMKKADQLIVEAVSEKDVNIEHLCEGIMAIATYLLVNNQQYKECQDFCGRQLPVIRNYVANGHDHTMISKVHVHMAEIFNAIATCHASDQTAGKKMLENKIAEIESEIERYKGIGSAGSMINLLYYCNLMAYQHGYDILGTERTLLYMDFLPLVAPNMAAQNKLNILNCRGNCYLLNGDKESAKKMWQQVKEADANFFNQQSDKNPLTKAFGK